MFKELDLTKYEKYNYPELVLKPLDQDWRWCHKYAYQVLSGEIVAGFWIRLACKRHLDDLERDDVYFCPEKAASVVKWFKYIPLTDAAGFQSTILLPWQIFFVCNLIAWLREDLIEDPETGDVTERLGTFTYRKYDRAFCLVGRKNGKTTIIAGLMLYIMYKSPFLRPRAYSLATKIDQAKEVWSGAHAMIRMSPMLRGFFKTMKNDITMPKVNGEFKPLPNDSKSLDGKNPLVASLDECHALKDAKLYGVIGSAFGAQKEGLFITITTAGFVLDGVCTTLHKNGKMCLDDVNYPKVKMENYLFLMYQIDNKRDSGIDDNWEDENAWIKANPGLGYQPQRHVLRKQFNEAKYSHEEKANFLTKHCNLFVSGADKWLDLDTVKLCRNYKMNIEDYKGRQCWVGIDRGQVSDITSICTLFDNDKGGADCFYINILPEGALREAGDQLKQTYIEARDCGDLIIVEGEVTKNKHISPYLVFLDNTFDVQMFGYDPWHMGELALDLEDEGLEMVAISQGTGNMSEPAKKLEELILEQTFTYNSNLLEFGAQNAIMHVSTMSNVKIYRENYKTEKIDPIIATIIALSCATLQKVDKNVYIERGLA